MKYAWQRKGTFSILEGTLSILEIALLSSGKETHKNTHKFYYFIVTP